MVNDNDSISIHCMFIFIFIFLLSWAFQFSCNYGFRSIVRRPNSWVIISSNYCQLFHLWNASFKTKRKLIFGTKSDLVMTAMHLSTCPQYKSPHYLYDFSKINWGKFNRSIIVWKKKKNHKSNFKVFIRSVFQNCPKLKVNSINFH